MRAVRIVALTVSVLWALLWISVIITMPRLPGDDAIVISLALLVGLLPSLAYWGWEYRRFRRRRERRALLSAEAREEWRRLKAARDLVQRFADEGWIDRRALRDVDAHIAQLRTLLEAGGRVEQVAGASSASVRGQVTELTTLLVALADSALEHQATLVTDAPAPVTLDEARARLRTRSQAYRDLREGR